jgi:DNA topoisomerase IA
MEQREPLHAWMHPIKRAKFDLITKKNITRGFRELQSSLAVGFFFG